MKTKMQYITLKGNKEADPDVYYKALGSKIEEIQKKTKLSRKDLAKEIGITENQFSRYSNGLARMKAHEISELCFFTKTDPAYLLDVKTEEKETDYDTNISDEKIKKITKLLAKASEEQKDTLLAFLMTIFSTNEADRKKSEERIQKVETEKPDSKIEQDQTMIISCNIEYF